jgi:hypothetical protein
MREAVGQVGNYADKYLHLVLRTLIWALPHQYRPVADEGTIVTVDVGRGGVWSLHSHGSGRWHLDEGGTAVADARIAFSDDAAWRWLTGAAWSTNQVVQDGPADLLEPVLQVRGIIV